MWMFVQSTSIIKKIYSDHGREEEATVRKFRIVQTEGTRQVNREVNHYNLQMIMAAGFKVNNVRTVQFRKRADMIVKDFTLKGWVMDEERLKNGWSVLTEQYFEQRLEKIREFRFSERKFYQKNTDIYAAALDCDPNAAAARRFFAAVRKKMHCGVHGQTAAELICERGTAKRAYGIGNLSLHSIGLVSSPAASTYIVTT